MGLQGRGRGGGSKKSSCEQVSAGGVKVVEEGKDWRAAPGGWKSPLPPVSDQLVFRDPFTLHSTKRDSVSLLEIFMERVLDGQDPACDKMQTCQCDSCSQEHVSLETFIRFYLEL